MLYTYGINHPAFEEVSREWILRHFKERDFVQADCETTGFDCHTDEMMCMQLGSAEEQYVIHPELLGEFRTLLTSKCLIGHNIKFDLKFLYKLKIFPNHVYDTMLAEQIIHNGNPTVRHNLAAVAKRRIDIDLDKSVRDNIWKEGLTERVIQYAGDDVKYLEDIRTAQLLDIKKWDLSRVLDLENDFTLVLAYIEYCGFKLDRAKWEQKMVKDLELKNQLEAGLNDYIWENDLHEFQDTQLDMFSTTQKTLVNWASPKQVIKLFKKLGINVTYVDKGVKKESVESTVIEKYSAEYPIIAKYLDYKGADKVVGTYGKSFTDQINPVTGRLHTNFKQIKDTGRISSGGKNKQTKESYINFQNIPSDKLTRACFVAEPGNTLVICDYSGQEQIVLANYSMDSNILEFYDKGLGDMHSFVASKMYPEIDGLDLEEIKTTHKDKRQEAKIAGFAINYGGVGKTIADQLNKPLEVGNRIYNAYFEAFPGLRKYFDRVKKEGLQKGYIQIDKVINRKCFVTTFEEYRKLQRGLNEQFWTNWKYLKSQKKQADEKGTHMNATDQRVYDEYKIKIARYFQIKGEIERNSLNYPIQGTAANITKLSAVLFFNWIKENGLVDIVKFCNQVHDENVVECPVDLKEWVGEALTDCMNQAGAVYCKRVPLTTAPDYSPFWKK